MAGAEENATRQAGKTSSAPDSLRAEGVGSSAITGLRRLSGTGETWFVRVTGERCAGPEPHSV
jgi:hypothetical protein